MLYLKGKKFSSRTCEKGFRKKLVGVLRMKPLTFHINMTQISRCEKKLFFSANHDFCPQKYGGKAGCTVHAQFCFEIFRFLEHVKKVVNKNW